ncbi:hypothetical protein [Bacteroides sp. 519]|uniref:hypothetical protein n=1 Tax=Bacteroides sp. 519 TaxID=2302937 RepID=UPI0013D8CE9A|nr:hypothetical protein [Bacteroides sp. 519]NDV59304.1 hypothetical protein [Bacteroides sp. 519]
MEMVLADLELDLREIRYLTRDLTHQPDEALIEVTKRRINQMQTHLEGLLLEMDKLSAKEDKEEDIIVEEKEEETIIPPVTTLYTDEEVVIKTNEPVVTLAQQIKPIVNLKEAFTLNDTFRFSRELFNGDIGHMNLVLDQMVQLEDWDCAVTYLKEEVKQDDPNSAEVFEEFQELIKKYFI